jgi:hypothetical protein
LYSLKRHFVREKFPLFRIPVLPGEEEAKPHPLLFLHSACLLTGGAVLVTLFGRAGNIPIGAEDAAVTRLRLEPFAATLAIVKPGAGIFRHRFFALKATVRTGECRKKHNLNHEDVLYCGSRAVSVSVMRP